ncbi:hypothetical protein [Reichenbachiella sp.]|uniref:hypothetical protein n=1 Tax=Reichenbachiella sp. TaxID=2184521 RepID=UPI003BB02501
MKWRKLGKVFDPTEHRLPNNCESFAQSPQAIVLEDRVRVYFSSREKEGNGPMFLSRVLYVDFAKDMINILAISPQEVLPLGELGTFDEHGIFPFSPVRVGNQIYAYTCGWSRRVSVPVETATGLAISEDNGNSFTRIGPGPVLGSSLKEAMLVGDSFVLPIDDKFYMWYIYGEKWKPATSTEPPARIYKIGFAQSKNGIQWEKEEGRSVIGDVLGPDECQALPTVIRLGGMFHMYFCFREATDFRRDPDRGYRLGYAYSQNGLDWVRDDNLGGLEKSDSGWDSEMMCYPHVFQLDEQVYMLYNGNEFGRQGFGLAKLESMNNA